MLTSRVLEHLAKAPALQRRITLGEYHRMIDVGLLDEDAHVELIEGVLVRTARPSPFHAIVISLLTKAFTLELPGRLAVRAQLPLPLGKKSEPEPDLAVVRRSDTDSMDHHPRSALLVVEVARRAAGFDRDVKGAVYARAKIPEYWLINVARRCVEIHRKPDARNGRYRSVEFVGDDRDISPRGFKGPRLSVRALLGPHDAN